MLNMFVVKIEDSGNHPEDVIIQFEECLWACLKSRSKKILEEGENMKGGDLRSELQSYIDAPHVMGSLFDAVSMQLVDIGEPKLFINVQTAKTRDPAGKVLVRGKSVFLSVVWRQPTLQGMCLEVIKESLGTRNEVLKLGLPRVLEDKLCSLFRL